MALIGNIRKHSGFIVAAIGISLGLFIINDMVNSSHSLFSRGGKAPKGIGEIYGVPVQQAEFNDTKAKMIDNYKQQQGPDASITPEIEGEISDKAWSEFTNKKILEKEYNDIGLTVTGNEIIDLCVGANPHPLALQYLTNQQTKKLEREQIYKFITTIDQNPKPEAKKFWNDFEDYLTQTRLQEKFSGLIKGGIFVTDLEARDEFNDRNKQASIQFVASYLRMDKDTDIKVSDDDIKNYYNKHKEDYKRTEGRTFDYVAFDITPTPKDTLNTLNWIKEQETPFKKTTRDSSFVARTGKSTFKNEFLPRGSFGVPDSIQDKMFAVKDSGTLIGPWYEAGSYKLVKVIAVSTADSLANYKASHILIKPTGNTEADTEAAENQIQALKARIEKGEDFAQLAKENSQDGSAQKGGDLGWFRADRMVKPFANAVKKGKKGDLIAVRTQFGAHLIKITENKSDKVVKAALLEKPVAAGEETQAAAQEAARKLREDIAQGDDFEKAVAKLQLNKRLAENVAPNDRTIRGNDLENQRDIIKWAYEQKVGDVSDPTMIGSKIIVAHLLKIQEDGYAKIEDIKALLTVAAKKEKLKDNLVDKFNKALTASKNLDDVAKAVGSNVSSAENVSFSSPMVSGLNAREPIFTGYIAGMQPNKISAPVRGDEGVYAIKLISFNTVNYPANFDQPRKQNRQMESQGADQLATEALKKEANVKDYRYLFY